MNLEPKNDPLDVATDHPVTAAYRHLAQDLYANVSEGKVEIDACAGVTECENGGAWVAAWVWVDNSHLPGDLLQEAKHPEPL